MKLEEHIIESSSGDYSRKVWLLHPDQGVPEKIGIFLDGEYYVNHMDAPSTVIQLQRSGAVPSLLCAFVSHVDGEARHRDLTCNPRYSGFIASDVVGWLRAHNAAIPEDGHLIAGTSLGGLASAFLALTHPGVFSCCLSQSGSFWWKNEWLKNNLSQMPRAKSKFWLSVGNKEIESGVAHPPTGLRQDVTQVSACERLAAALVEQGHSVHYDVYEGGHEIKPWKDELPKALSWLFDGKNETSTINANWDV